MSIYNNTNQIPYINKLNFFFKIYNLIDLDDVRSYNYAYLFRFFFGRKALFTKYKLKFHLGINYYTFIVYCFFFKQACFFPLAVFLNDFLTVSSDQFFFSSLSLCGKFFSGWFSDMNIFLEKKTNIGFYNLKDPLGFKLVFFSVNFFSSLLLINMLN